eukprot:5617283-Ditylum_brightwellii.AAC.1
MKGSEIKKIPSADSVLPMSGVDPIHMVSLPLAIPVYYAHGLQLGKVTNEDIIFDAEAYHPLMGLWLQITQQRGSAGGHSPGNYNKDEPFIVNTERCLDMIKNSNITAWLKDHPNC